MPLHRLFWALEAFGSAVVCARFAESSLSIEGNQSLPFGRTCNAGGVATAGQRLRDRCSRRGKIGKT